MSISTRKPSAIMNVSVEEAMKQRKTAPEDVPDKRAGLVKRLADAKRLHTEEVERHKNGPQRVLAALDGVRKIELMIKQLDKPSRKKA